MLFCFFFFNDTATTEIYTLSLHDALPILEGFDKDWVDAGSRRAVYYTNIPPGNYRFLVTACNNDGVTRKDRKSTRLNSSHSQISYAVFCLKKKKQIEVDDCPRHIELRAER